MTITYVMVSFENYNPTWATGMDDPLGTPPFVNGSQDKVSVGVRFDAVRRIIPYQIGQYDTVTQTNSTGFTLWSSGNVIAPGGSYAALDQFNQSICIKNIDTGVVTFYNCYNSANLVPAGIGPTAKGTYTFIANPTAGQDIVLNGVTWTFVASGATGSQTNIQADTLSTVQQLSWDLNGSADSSLTPAYYTAGDTYPPGSVALGIVYKTGGAAGNAYTLAAGSYGGDVSGATLAGGDTASDGTWRRFVEASAYETAGDPMMVDPRTGNLWQHVDAFGDPNDICLIYLFRASDDFSLVISPLRPPPGQGAHMELVGISDDWVYVIMNAGGAHNNTLTLTPRTITAEETTLDSLLVYAEYVYDPLWNDYYFRNVFNHSTSMFTFGGARTGTRAFKLYRFDEPSSAPFGGPTVGGGFTDITPWGASTGPNTNVTAYTVDGIFATPSTEIDNKYLLYYLPGTDDLVCITELWAGDTPTGWSDPTLTRFDCTYVNVGGGTFDYHQAFVTGYMTAGWTTTAVAADAAWVVLGTYEVDLYLGQNTYDFSGLGKDYTKRWIYFQVQPVVSGSWSYSAATTHIIMVQYQFASGAPPIVVQVVDEQGWDDAYTAYATAIGNSNVVARSIGLRFEADKICNSGIFDDGSNVFIWDGFAEDNNLRHLGPVPDRISYYNSGEATTPFLRLSFASTPTPAPTPSVAAGGYSYFIERMDNRIWPTIEDAWCLDAALSYPQPTPAGTLTISSATGGRGIGSYNLINGGSGYTAPIGQIVDLVGPGTGASVSLTVAGGVITVATASTTGSGYVQPQLTVLDATGVGAVVQPIVTNYVTLSCSTASFSASNVGDIVRAGGGKIEIVTYGTTASTTTTVTGNVIVPITATLPNDPDNTPIPVTSGSWTMTTPTTSVGGLSHLEGKTVYALADGGVVRNLTVSNGHVTLPVSASQILVGLQYTAQLQTMYLEAGGSGPTVQTRRKDGTQVVVRVDSSAAPEVGMNQPDAAAQPNGATVPWTNMAFVPTRTPAVPAGQAVPLFSGDFPITNLFTTWDAKGQIAVQQRDPVPLTVTALVPWLSIGDTPSSS